MSARAFSTSADVILIGAGLSGLVAAHRLIGAGIEDVLLLEARERPGGRVSEFACPNGRTLEAGGEFLAPHMESLAELASELGLELDPLPSDGAHVRIFAGERFVEEAPFAADPDAGEAYERAASDLDELAAQVPVEAPWDAPGARELDSTTLAPWIESNVPNLPARQGLAGELNYCGADFSELSLLHTAWTIRCMGGWWTWTESQTHRLAAGTSTMIRQLAARLGERILLRAPVRRVEHGDEGVTVIADGHEIRARLLIAAIAPGFCGRIAWDPPLPGARDRLHGRFLQGHGVKFTAIYDEPWWREKGLAGTGTGLSPISLLIDNSPPGGRDGVLVGQAPVTGSLAASHSRALADVNAAKDLFLNQAAEYLGGEAKRPNEVYMFSWIGDPWSAGCAAGLPPGVLSTVGPSLHEPIGSIVWAGAETGLPQNDWLEGAVAAGVRAAAQARDVLEARA